jgi:branched-subunit amino acid ABC-type transport system permease component
MKQLFDYLPVVVFFGLYFLSGRDIMLATWGISLILQQAIPVLPDDTEESLAARILPHEHRLLPEVVRLLAAGRLKVEGTTVRILPEK